MKKEYKHQYMLYSGPFSDKFLKRIRTLGFIISILILWNILAELIYIYSPDLSGAEYFSAKLWGVISSAGGRPHELVMLAQTSGWLYPFYALTFYFWWIGLRKAGFWLSALPAGLLAYATLMMGGTQATGLAYLSVLSQAREAVGSVDPFFYRTAGMFIVQHFIRANLTVMITLPAGLILHAAAVLSGRTSYPRWFTVFSPLAVLILILASGYMLPAPVAGFVLAPVLGWIMLIPSLANTIWLWKNRELI